MFGRLVTLFLGFMFLMVQANKLPEVIPVNPDGTLAYAESNDELDWSEDADTKAESEGELWLDGDSLALDSAEIQHQLSQTKFVIRDFNHKEQVITGGVIMLCIILIMTSVNNYNPRQ
jgi:hypothetical protein